MTQKRTYRIVATKEEIDAWLDIAKGSGSKLNDWIRWKLNDGKAYNPRKVESVVSADRDSVTGERLVRITKAVDVKRKCKHGEGKGYYCWQCMGLAVVE